MRPGSATAFEALDDDDAARVLRPGGSLALWWEVDAGSAARTSRTGWRRPTRRTPGTYRKRPYAEELHATGLSADVTSWEGRGSRTLNGPWYARWLRSTSYVAQLDDPQAFPDGQVVEPFRVVLHMATVAR